MPVTPWFSEIKLDDWNHFKNFATQVVKQGHLGQRSNDLLFRGQGKSTYKLEASLDRVQRRLPPGERNRLQDEAVRVFTERSASSDTDSLTAASRLAILQHYGAPTRLLDWSESLYVAAFFAMSGGVAGDRSASDVAVWILNRKGQPFVAGVGVEVVHTPFNFNTRAQAQAGYFTLNTSLESTLEDFLNAYYGKFAFSGEPILSRVLLPVRDAELALADLRQMRISHESLFPDLQGLSLASYLQAIENL